MKHGPPLPTRPDCCLFLDIDGTLLEFAPSPGSVRVDDSLRDLLGNLDLECDGAVALVSGRSITDIDGLFAPLCLAAAGVHGCERRDAHGHMLRPQFESSALHELQARVRVAARPLDGVIIEDKGCGFAAHFRLVPWFESALRAILQRFAPWMPEGFEILEGDHVIEIKPVSHNKATAVEAFMQEEPFTGRLPVFIGDDISDQDGFAAVHRHHGLAIGVGENINTEWRLPNPLAVREWLESFLMREISI
jgi:trehalose 6-phosphate phosphatase